MEKTIYKRIEEAVSSKCENVKFDEGYPCDRISVPVTITDDENGDTITPLVNALEVITETLKKYAKVEDDIRIDFRHQPNDETWDILISDGR